MNLEKHWRISSEIEKYGINFCSGSSSCFCIFSSTKIGSFSIQSKYDSLFAISSQQSTQVHVCNSRKLSKLNHFLPRLFLSKYILSEFQAKIACFFVGFLLYVFFFFQKINLSFMLSFAPIMNTKKLKSTFLNSRFFQSSRKNYSHCRGMYTRQLVT